MAGVRLTCQSPKITFSTSTITLLQIKAAANQRVVVSEVSVSFDGTSNTAAPIQVDLLRQSTAGTMTSLTPAKVNSSDSETVQTTAQHTATVEPTASTLLMTEQVHPQTGFLWQARFGEEIIVPGGGYLGVRLVTPGAGADAVARMTIVE